jgi:ribose 5-phosphate isomerase A
MTHRSPGEDQASADADPDSLKRAVARRALELVAPGSVVGVGTGSTVAHFIMALGERRRSYPRAVSSSERSTRLLREQGIEVIDLNEVTADGGRIETYVDGADEVDPALALIKGGGGALTREKIIAEASRRFVCIIDAGKLVPVLGGFPLPIEVIPMARELIIGRLRALGADPVWRKDVVTDNGNLIVAAAGLAIRDPEALEAEIEHWPGVVTVGLFARRRADVLLVARSDGVTVTTRGD